MPSHWHILALAIAFFIGNATFADAQENKRTAAEIQAEIDKLQIELQAAKELKRRANSTVPEFGAVRIFSPHSDMFVSDWVTFSQRRRAFQNFQFHEAVREQQILQQLEMPVTLNNESALPLETALKMFCDQVGIPVFLDRAALSEAGISVGTMVSVPRGNGIKIRLDTVLNAILDQHNLAWVVSNEMLRITTQRRAMGAMVVRIYYTGDFPCGGLLDIIQTVIEPESWVSKQMGGEGIIEMHPSTKSLAIRQTEAVHAQIESLLEQIRELNETRTAETSPDVVR